jgi:4-hydroxybutyrate dehydrogenase
MFPSHIRFGAGSIGTLTEETKSLWGTRVLIVTDAGVRATGLLDPAIDALKEGAIAVDVCDEVTPNPSDALVEEVAARYRSDGHNVLIAVGGGSVIDAAKGAQVRITHPGHIRDYFLSGEGDKKIIPNMPRLIAVPTTAGTGSETTAAAVLTDSRTNVKKVVYSPHIRPAIAIVDPELTLGLPPSITAATGMDALTHCIEAYTSRYFAPIAKSIALGGIELIAGSLVAAFQNGNDREARSQIAMASIMGGLAFGTGGGLGAVHALAHQLSTEVNLSHGLANAVLLPHVMSFNAEEHPAPYLRIATALGGNTPGLNQEEAIETGLAFVRDLQSKLGIATSLGRLGVTHEDILRMVPKAMSDVCLRQNPRKCSESDLKRLYELAL